MHLSRCVQERETHTQTHTHTSTGTRVRRDKELTDRTEKLMTQAIAALVKVCERERHTHIHTHKHAQKSGETRNSPTALRN